MYDYDNEIRKLSNQFYEDYPQGKYPELLAKQQRSYEFAGCKKQTL